MVRDPTPARGAVAGFSIGPSGDPVVSLLVHSSRDLVSQGDGQAGEPCARPDNGPSSAHHERAGTQECTTYPAASAEGLPSLAGGSIRL